MNRDKALERPNKVQSVLQDIAEYRDVSRKIY